MKKLVLMAAVAALSACNQNKAEPAPAATEAAATPAAVATARDSAASMAGTYDYTYQGKATTTVAKEDGTYEDTQAGKVIEKGKWSQTNGQTCFADDKGNPPKCWTTTQPDSMGMFTATSADGKTVMQITKKKA